MADEIPITDLTSPWNASYIIASFLIGLVIGGITGYFGNWLWYRFGPIRHRPHITLTEEEGNVSFSGYMTDENEERIFESLRAIKTKPTGKETKIQAPESETSTTAIEGWL